MSDELLFEVNNEIGLITFNRPDSRNALTFAMYDRLAEIAAEVTERVNKGDRSIKAIVVTGSGDKAFAAGTDISSFRDFNTDEQALGYERQMDRVLGAYEEIPVPTIAAIPGCLYRWWWCNCRGIRFTLRRQPFKVRLSDGKDARQLFIGKQSVAPCVVAGCSQNA